MNTNSVSTSDFGIMENHAQLRNLPLTASKYEKVELDINSTELLECVKAHSGIQRTVINNGTTRTSFEFYNFKVGDILPRNKIVLKRDNWTLKNS